MAKKQIKVETKLLPKSEMKFLPLPQKHFSLVRVFLALILALVIFILGFTVLGVFEAHSRLWQ